MSSDCPRCVYLHPDEKCTCSPCILCRERTTRKMGENFICEKCSGETTLHDSGQRQEFGTGMVRDTAEGKPNLILITPYGLHRLGMHYYNGAKKYAPRNWEKGQPISRTMDSCFRHLMAYMMGDRSEDHLAAVAWNAFAAMHYEEMIKRGKLSEEFDDMPHYEDENYHATDF